MLQMYSPVSCNTADDTSNDPSDSTRCLADEGKVTEEEEEVGENVQVMVMLVREDRDEEQVS